MNCILSDKTILYSAQKVDKCIDFEVCILEGGVRTDTKRQDIAIAKKVIFEN